MVQKSLSDVSIANLKTEGYYWDKVPGFGVRVGKRRKAFIVVRGGRRTTLGVYPHLSLADARQLALTQLYTVNSIKTKALPVRTAVEAYLAQLRLKARTILDYRRFLTLYLLPKLGTKDIAKVTSGDIIPITDELLDTPSECRHTHAAMQTFFNWCTPRYIKISPMAGLKSPTKAKHRSRTLTDDELKRVWHASLQLGNYGIVIRGIILLAARRSEIPGPRTLEEKHIIFHDPKNRKDHALPITPYMHDLLKQVQPTNGWSKNKKRLDKLSGVIGFVHHDLRRTTSSNLHRVECGGTDPFVVERILNHSLPKLQKIYNWHDYTEDMREPLQKHEDWLLALVKS